LMLDFHQRRGCIRQDDAGSRVNTFSREALLGVRAVLLAAGHLQPAPKLVMGTVSVLEAEAVAEDPRLDDEMLISRLEARLSRESGADARNEETFGSDMASSGGWSFEEALEANGRLQKMDRSGNVAGGDSVRSMTCRLETPTGIVHGAPLRCRVRPNLGTALARRTRAPLRSRRIQRGSAVLRCWRPVVQ